jgi:hypothetical protein
MSKETDFEIDWEKYPKLAAIFEHRPRVNVYWVELTQLLLEVQNEADTISPALCKLIVEALDRLTEAVRENTAATVQTAKAVEDIVEHQWHKVHG